MLQKGKERKKGLGSTRKGLGQILHAVKGKKRRGREGLGIPRKGL